jgi:predicted nucleic acid-binding protein
MEKKPEAESKGLSLIDVRDQKDKKLAIRITDKGAIVAVEQTLNAIMFISSILKMQKIKDIEELVGVLKDRLGKFLGWLDRVPDGTLFAHGITKEHLNNLKKSAREVMSWAVVPTDEDYKQWEKNLKEFEATENKVEEPKENRVKVLTDTSFLLSYLAESDANSSSARVIVAYLKTQQPYFDLYLPYLVLLELISKLKQKYSFKKARLEFGKLLDEISKSRVALSDGKINLYEIFDRYETFSKKKLSSSLRSNDFMIATDGILANAMILTCDRKMHDGIRKTYQDVYLVTDSNKSYLNFINNFEKRKID